MLKGAVAIAEQNVNRAADRYRQVGLGFVPGEVAGGDGEGLSPDQIVAIIGECAVAVPKQDAHFAGGRKLASYRQIELPVVIEIARRYREAGHVIGYRRGDRSPERPIAVAGEHLHAVAVGP